MATLLKEVQTTAPRGTPAWFVDMVEKSARGPIMEMVNLTPQLAKFMLDVNADNRAVRNTKVAQYAADMSAGNWALNGEPIIISKDGNLNDGQHRCFAVIESNTEVPVFLLFGIERETRLTVDQGAARSAGDYLGMEGVHNATIAASISRLVIAFERAGQKSIASANYITNAEIRARVSQDDNIAASATYAATQAKATRTFAAPAIIGFCHYVLSSLNQANAKAYLDQVCRGEGIRAKDPAYAVRERLITMGKVGGRERKVSVIFRGWNAYRQGRTLALAKVAKGEDGANLPAII